MTEPMTEQAFEVFFDGQCPLCRREIDMLQRLDRGRGRIACTDIASPTFDPATLGVDREQLMARIHGRLPNGTLVEGVEVFRQLYAAVGFRRAVAATRVPGVSHLLDVAYDIFARNRLRITGRCTDETCELPPARGSAA